MADVDWLIARHPRWKSLKSITFICSKREVNGVESYEQRYYMSSHKEKDAQCVNCHMSENRYMGVDDRRDHSFKIPRPDLSLTFNTPNPCTSCHEDKSNQWASETLHNWHGKAKAVLPSKQLLMVLNSGQAIPLDQHLSILTDKKLDVISRATAIGLLSYARPTLSADVLVPYLIHAEPLFRLNAANVASLMPPADKIKYLTPLLGDDYKSVRVAAARSLVTSDISSADQKVFDQAFKALIHANNINSWRGEGMANKGVLAIEMNKLKDAEKSFKKAIKIEPYFEAGYINLADIYRAKKRPFQVASVLKLGIKNNPKSASLYYSYGLHFVRQKKLDKGLLLFEKAMMLKPENSQYAYTYILALDGAGQSRQALTKLKTLIINYQDITQLKELGLYLSQKLKSRPEYDWFIKL